MHPQMKQRIYSAILIKYIIIFGSLNKSYKTDMVVIQDALYYLGLLIIAYMFFKNSNREVLNRLPRKMAIYFLIVSCLTLFSAFRIQ